MKKDGVGAGLENGVCLGNGFGDKLLELVTQRHTLLASRMLGGNNPLAKLLPLSETWRSREDEPRGTY